MERNVIRVSSVTGRTPVPAFWQSNCMILGAGQPPFVWAGSRPNPVIWRIEVIDRTPTSEDLLDLVIYGSNQYLQFLERSSCRVGPSPIYHLSARSFLKGCVFARSVPLRRTPPCSIGEHKAA